MTKRLKSFIPFFFVIFLCFFLWKGLNLNPAAVFPKETFVEELESSNSQVKQPEQSQFKNPEKTEFKSDQSQFTNLDKAEFNKPDQSQFKNIEKTEFNKPDQYQFKSPDQEILFNDLVHELRCLVCQNQNLAESQAEAAVNIRNLIYHQILASKTKHEILDALVNRYGEFILYKPAFHSKTIILWLGPALLLFFALFIFYRIFFRRDSV